MSTSTIRRHPSSGHYGFTPATDKRNQHQQALADPAPDTIDSWSFPRPGQGTIPCGTLAHLGFNPQGDQRHRRLEPGDDELTGFFATHPDLVGGYRIDDEPNPDTATDDIPEEFRDFLGD